MASAGSVRATDAPPSLAEQLIVVMAGEEIKKSKKTQGKKRGGKPNLFARSLALLKSAAEGNQDPIGLILGVIRDCQALKRKESQRVQIMAANWILSKRPSPEPTDAHRSAVRAILDSCPMPSALGSRVWARIIAITRYPISPSVLAATVRQTLFKGGSRVDDASDAVQVLGLSEHFSPEEVLSPLIKRDALDAVRRCVDRIASYRPDAIRLVARNPRRVKTALKWIQQFGLRDSDFPEVYKAQHINTVSWLVKSGKAEEFYEIVCAHPHLREPFLKKLVAAGNTALADRLAREFKMPLKGAIKARKEVKAPQIDKPTEPSRPQPKYYSARAPGGVLFVNDKSTVAAASADLFQSDIVGIDAESMPAMFSVPAEAKQEAPTAADSKSPKHKKKARKKAERSRAESVNQPTLLQLSTRDKTYLFDLLTLRYEASNSGDEGGTTKRLTDGGSGMIDTLSRLFGSEKIMKIGYSWRDDTTVLRKAFGPGFLTPTRGLIDLDRAEKDIWFETERVRREAEGGDAKTARERPRLPRLGLSRVVKCVFGEGLNKDSQVSNWSRRPLRPAQVQYAALDAFALVAVVDRLWDRRFQPRAGARAELRPLRAYVRDVE